MVYSIGKVSVYETEPDNEVVGTREGVWDKVEYLHPDSVDKIARARRRSLMSYGYPVVPETAPKAVLWKSKTKLPPDYAFGNNEIMLVSVRFRDLVERFEPGIHQFLPVEMYFSKKDEKPFDTFYWFVCCQLIDSLDPEHTTIPWDGEYEARREDGRRWGSWQIDAEAQPPQKAVFSLKAIGDRHLWRDPYFGRGTVNCSNAFGDAVKFTKLNGFALSKDEQI